VSCEVQELGGGLRGHVAAELLDRSSRPTAAPITAMFMLRGSGGLCRWVLTLFTIAYVATLALLAIGVFGLFSQPRDPLSGILLVPLGLPWNLFLDGVPEAWRPWLATGAPAVNMLLALACHLRTTHAARGSRMSQR
jgi:hypothetical protein